MRLAYAAIAAISLWLRLGFPVMALGGAGADDALFVRQAAFLAQGRWLGPYDNLTLAKGPVYPMFIAASSFLAAPLKLTEHLVYLAVAALVAVYVARQAGRRWLGLALFTLLALNPVFWDPLLARVIREGLYVSLSLAVVGLAVLATFDRGGGVRRALQGVALGLVAGAFWLTREEGLWIVPALAVVFCLALAVVAVRRRWASLGGVAIALLAACVGFGTVYGAVAGLNDRYYGAFATNEFKSGAFVRAYGAISRIVPDAWRRYVVFPADARRRAYAVSSAAAELRPFLDGDEGEGWRRVGCEQMQLAAAACPEILSGWFMWALRDAATAAGHGGSWRSARVFYRQIADQIDAACDDGRLRCLPARATLAPPFRWQYVTDTLQTARAVAGIVLTLGGGNVATAHSSGNPEALAAFRDMVGPIAAEDEAVRWRIVAWAAAPGDLPDIAVRSGPGIVRTTFTERNGADVSNAFPGYAALRFELVAECGAVGCDLVVTTQGVAPLVLPLVTIATGTWVDTPAIKLYVESASMFDPLRISRLRQGAQLRFATLLGAAYRLAMPAAFGLAVLGLAAALLLRRGVPAALYALSLASVTAIVCRVLILSYLDATSIPSANSLYASPASPFVIVFTVVGLYAGAVAAGALRARPQAAAHHLLVERGRPGAGATEGAACAFTSRT